jgi:hypothetical protein
MHFIIVVRRILGVLVKTKEVVILKVLIIMVSRQLSTVSLIIAVVAQVLHKWGCCKWEV